MLVLGDGNLRKWAGRHCLGTDFLRIGLLMRGLIQERGCGEGGKEQGAVVFVS